MTKSQKRRIARKQEQKQQSTQAAAPKPQLDDNLREDRELLINTMALSYESRAKLGAMFDQFHADFQPQGIVETHLVETLIVNRWRYLRYLNIETSLLDLQMERDEKEIEKQWEFADNGLRIAMVFEKQSGKPGTLNLATQLVARTERAYQTTLKTLRQIQKDRGAGNRPAGMPQPDTSQDEPTAGPETEKSGFEPKTEPPPAQTENRKNEANPPTHPIPAEDDLPKGRTWHIIPNQLLHQEGEEEDQAA